MRKKSHISLAKYIVKDMEVPVMTDHRKAFYLGSILPDCKPSFLTQRHEFEGTFEMVKERICDLSLDAELILRNARAFMRRLGEIIHYIADYFTFPHNMIYEGGFKEHCVYEKELKLFHETLVERRTLPPNFVRDIIMKAPSRDMMNSISRSILNLYSYDAKADDTTIPNVLRQCLNLISQFPMLMVYGYHAYNYRVGEDLFIYAPSPELSTAENILMMLREDRKYTKLEAKILDMALVLHMDHGGGNNSTFTTHVVTSSGTDTYSTMAAAMASLKGPKHGGANIKVTQMFEDMKQQLSDWEDEDAVRAYLCDLLDKKAFDKKGLIYGMGHAVYSVSDPRADIFKKFVKQLAKEKGYEKEYALYELVEHMAPEVIGEKRKIYKGVNANVDFYSGLVYSMLNLPKSLYTPIFAAARIVGWSAHRLEELKNVDKIIRPAYKALADHREYIPLEER